MENKLQEVSVVDIRMGFWSMVGFMVQWAIASIPAAIILFGIVLGLCVAAYSVLPVLGGLIGGLSGLLEGLSR